MSTEITSHDKIIPGVHGQGVVSHQRWPYTHLRQPQRQRGTHAKALRYAGPCHNYRHIPPSFGLRTSLFSSACRCTDNASTDVIRSQRELHRVRLKILRSRSASPILCQQQEDRFSTVRHLIRWRTNMHPIRVEATVNQPCAIDIVYR